MVLGFLLISANLRAALGSRHSLTPYPVVLSTKHFVQGELGFL